MHSRPRTRHLALAAAAAAITAIAATFPSFTTARATAPMAVTTTTPPAAPPAATTTVALPTSPPGTNDPGPATIPEPPVSEPPPATLPPESEAPETAPPPPETVPATDPPPPPAPLPTATATTPATTTEAAAEPDGPSLRILLTNDDGWDAEGITAVREALTAAGHDVVIVAPMTNQSGTGARVTFVGELTLTQQSEGVFSVDGSPADATELGLDIAFGGARPDLVISGSNAGQNVGAIAVHSGTLGAVVTAINDGVPAIAVSTEQDLSTGGGDFEGTADFVVAVVNALAERAADGPVLPDGIGLSINYPLVEGGGDPAGVAVTTTDSAFVDIDYSAVSVPAVGEDGRIGPGLTVDDPTDPDGDTAKLAEDFVTVTFIAGDYDVVAPAGAAAVDDIGPLLVDLAL